MIPAAVTSAIGLPEDRDRSIAEVLRDWLREREVLLVLDNLEQIEGAASAVDGLLADAPRIRVLATSRAPLHVAGEQKSGFNPDGLTDFIRSQDQTGTNTARQLMPELQLTIHDATLALLRSLFGHDETGWWRKGVPEKVRTEVAARRETNPDGGAYDQFFELLDYRSIAAANWDSFTPYFAFGSSKGKENQLAWFSRLSAKECPPEWWELSAAPDAG